MRLNNEQKLQTLRTIDKFDKIGRDGVVDLLQKDTDEFGANLDPVSAGLIGLFLDTDGATNEETLDNVKKFFKHAGRVRSRLQLMIALEETVDSDGKTKWDRLLEMQPNDDESWNDGGRPANIAWALDDMVEVMASRRGVK